MRILVTGGAGFIGSYLTRELLARGDDVIPIDNFSDYYSRRAKDFNLDLIREFIGEEIVDSDPTVIKDILAKLEEYNPHKDVKEFGKFTFIEGDIRDFDLLENLFEEHKPDKVVHLAAMAGVPYSIKKPLLYTSVNIDGTVNLLELCAQNNIKNFVFGSSSSVFGSTKKVPFSEDADVDHPISPYAATKRMGEIMCFTYHHLYQYPITCVRIFGPIFGPLQRPYGMAAQKFIRQVDHGLPITLYGDGTMQRDSTYIDDEVHGLILALDKNLDFEIINVGTGSPIENNYLAEKIVEYMGKGEVTHVEQPKTEVPITYADNSKAKKTLGFEAIVPFDEGLRRQVEVYNMMPDWYKNLKI